MTNGTFAVIPRHVGIIMDGNGRWAEARGHKRSFGHKQGVKNILPVAKTLFECGVEYLSLYAFSTENFNRPKNEIHFLLDLLKRGIKKQGEECLKMGARLVVSGDTTAFGEDLHNTICDYVERTKVYAKPVVNICLNYGARQELCRAFNLMLENGVTTANENKVEEYLFNSLPPLDLVVRTGGEQRLSNFMLWQACYAELYFTDRLWPDFTKEDCLDALNWFTSRKRRFGKV